MKHSRTIIALMAAVLLLASCHEPRKSILGEEGQETEIESTTTTGGQDKHSSESAQGGSTAASSTTNRQTSSSPTEPATPAMNTTAATRAELSVATFTAKVEGISTSGQIRMAQDSVVWVSISKMVELGRAMATPDSVWISAPLLGRNFAGTYAELSSRVGRTITFAYLQEVATDADAESRIANLALSLGFDATVNMRSRKLVDALTFPFKR